MANQISSTILFFYGSFLILSGIVSVVFIGLKAKTALISGGMSGAISIGIGWLLLKDMQAAQLAGIVFPLALFIVFSWRCTKTFFRLFEMISSQHAELKGKGIAFLIIGLMAVVSLMVVMLQVSFYFFG
jgi:hypothetical protein